MKYARKVILILGLLAAVVCSWTGPMDSPATAQVDASLKKAFVTFASARLLSGLMSIAQTAQLDFQPAGIGVSLSPGQMLAPLNELVKHFADLMLLACIALGIQKVLIGICSYWVVSLVLTLVMLAWVVVRFRQVQPPKWLSSAMVLMLMVRFAIPAGLLAAEEVSQKFLAEDYTLAQAAIDRATNDAVRVKIPEPPASDDKSWLPKMPVWVPSIAEVKEQYANVKQAVEQSTEQVVKLMVVFLLQTLLLPLMMLWALFRIVKVSLD
jgi:hypothetical protein